MLHLLKKRLDKYIYICYTVFIMRPIDIKRNLMRNLKTQAAIARKVGVSRGFVHQVIMRIRNTESVRQAIAKAIKKPYQEVWPEQNNKEKAA